METELMSAVMKRYGLTEQLCRSAAAFPGCTAGRVLSQEKGLYRVVHAGGEQIACVSGRYRYEAQTVSDYPAAGDFVMLEPGDGCSPAVIRAVLPRKSVFIRKAAGTGGGEQVIAANVDVAFLCMSLNSDFNVRRLERYLSMVWESGAAPVVLLTKADLCGNIPEKRADAAAAAGGADVLVTSGLEQDGCRSVLPYLAEGRTIAFIGSSGVGKSTLINCLLGEDRIRTGGLRAGEKGRHTTTHRELLLLPGGGIVMDTPGMRELGMWNAADGIEKTFADIENLTRLCKFRNCTHGSEPGCAICAALENGTLSRQRWMSYRKLQTENAYAENSERYLAAKEQRFRGIALRNRTNRNK